MYIGTGMVILLSLCLIGFVIVQTRRDIRQRKYNEQRNKYLVDRIAGVEELVKTQFAEVLNALKNSGYGRAK